MFPNQVYPFSSGPIIVKTGPNLEKKLMDAAVQPDEGEIRRLIEEERIPIASINDFGQTAAHVAAINGNLPVLRYLMGKEPSLVSALDKFELTPLLAAVEKGVMSAVEYLVDHCNANVFQKSGLRTEDNALHVAAEAGQLQMVRYLIEKKGMDANERNSRGQTAALLAARDDHLDIVAYLAEKANADLTVADKERRNILFHAASAFNGSLRVPKYVLDQRNASIDINWKDWQGNTVTHFACRMPHYDLIKYFVDEKHADVNVADNENRTALFVASKKGDLKLTDYLLDHGADVTIVDVFNRTALETKADRAYFDPKVVERLSQAKTLRTRRSLMADGSEQSFWTRQPAPGAEGISWRSADALDGEGRGTGLMADQLSPSANSILFLAQPVLWRRDKRGAAFSREAVVDSRIDPMAVDVIHSDSFRSENTH